MKHFSRGYLTSTTSLKIDSLPEKYSKIKVFVPELSEYYAPKCPDSEVVPDSPLFKDIKEEYSWLDPSVRKDHCWSSYHASKEQYLWREKDFTSILPLLCQKVHTLSMQHHCMTIVTDTIKEVNPGQTPVDACDQPIYALTKQLQWRYPAKFKNYFSLFGGLHVEKSLLAMHSDFIQGSGLSKVLGIGNLSIASLQTTVLTVPDIKGAHYALQVSVCAIYQKLVEAHSLSGSSMYALDWLNAKSKTQVMALYWRLIMELQTQILLYIRERNFQLHIMALHALMKWYFLFDHFNYSRWLTVHLFDLVNLQKKHPGIYYHFCKGFFSFNKTSSQFSAMALDQIHEQNNELIKGAGGATCLLNREEESSLLPWELCGSEITNIC